MAMPHAFREDDAIITPTELHERLAAHQAPLLVDVREPGEFAEAHIPGAVNYPLSRFTAIFRNLDRHKEIVLICRSGNRSGIAQQFLVAQGYTRTRNLISGMMGWPGPTG